MRTDATKKEQKPHIVPDPFMPFRFSPVRLSALVSQPPSPVNCALNILSNLCIRVNKNYTPLPLTTISTFILFSISGMKAD
jgi:hypothetical protein